MTKLPQNLTLDAMQNKWASSLDPMLSNPTLDNLVLKSVPLVVGANVINHKLGRKLQGWKITRQRGPAALYDTQDTNQMQHLTLILVSDANVTIDLEVF